MHLDGRLLLLWSKGRMGFCTQSIVLNEVILVSIRQEKGPSQRDLAKKLKRIHTFVSKYERGERRVDVVEFLDIAKALETDPHEIINRLIK
jgi:transcriptional regulator with XRE-family HTH domain